MGINILPNGVKSKTPQNSIAAGPAIRPKSIGISGATFSHTKNKNIIKTTIEYCSKTCSYLANLQGSNEKRILDPSSGGKGIRLKTAKAMLIKTMSPLMK
jgi:hypothetical protein